MPSPADPALGPAADEQLWNSGGDRCGEPANAVSAGLLPPMPSAERPGQAPEIRPAALDSR